MNLKRSFILLIIPLYCLIDLVLSKNIHQNPSSLQPNDFIQRLSRNHWLQNADKNVKRIMNEAQPLIESLSSEFNSLYENYKENMTNKSLYYLDKIKRFKTNSNEDCYTYGYQVMYSAYLEAIDNVTDCFKQELQEFKENNIPIDQEMKKIIEDIDYECHDGFFLGCKPQLPLSEINMMIMELENTKDQMLKKDFTDEISFTKLSIDECTEFSIVKLDELLDNGVLKAIECKINSEN